jgi:hypothetical protein
LAVAGVGVQVRGGSVIFDPLTDRLSWLCRVGKCPGRTLWHTIGACLWKGHFTRGWLFCWLWRGESIFENTSLPVGTAGFESATP